MSDESAKGAERMRRKVPLTRSVITVAIVISIFTLIVANGRPAVAYSISWTNVLSNCKNPARGPVDGTYVNLCVRLQRGTDDLHNDSWWRAYGAMDATGSYPSRTLVSIDSIQVVDYNTQPVHSSPDDIIASTGHHWATDYVNAYTDNGYSIWCYAYYRAIMKYHISWPNGQRTPASGSDTWSTGYYFWNPCT